MRHPAPIVLAVTALAIVVSGCSHRPASRALLSGQPHPEITMPAVVKGYAAPCAGAIMTGDLPVRVTLRRHHRIVATLTVRYSTDRDRYRFSVPPGTYTISATHASEPARTVTVSSGQVTTVDFPNRCL